MNDSTTAGMGMFSEAYIVFSVGNIKPMLAAMYPYCFGKLTPKDCNGTAQSQLETYDIPFTATDNSCHGVFTSFQ